MKKVYKTPSIKVICDVLEPILNPGSQDIGSIDNNPGNGGSTLGNTPGINYGEIDWTGGNLNEGDLE